MCISTSHANFSKTKILTLALDNNFHFTAYQNDAENLSNQPNALILPIPGRTKPEYFVNTASFNKFLEEIVEEKSPISRNLFMKSLSMERSFEIFNLGQYTIGLTDSLDGMLQFLNAVEIEKRPNISTELLKFFASHYPNWSFAICLFDARDKMKAQPIAYKYEPFNYDLLFYPTMDSHDGSIPMLDNEIMDHSFILPTRNREISEFFSQEVPDYIKNNSYNVYNRYSVMFGQNNGDCYYTKNGEFYKTFNFANLLLNYENA